MSLLVYAIADADAAVAGTGLDDSPLYSVSAGPLKAIVSRHDAPGPKTSVETLWHYERSMDRLMSAHTILPAQFASTVSDEAATRLMLARRQSDLLAALDRVRGAVELALSAAWRSDLKPAHESPPMSAGPGRAYLHGRLQRHVRAREVAGTLNELAPLTRSRRPRQNPRPETALQIAYLVDREMVDAFIELVEALDARLPDVELVCTGPWPPYSFTTRVPA